MNTFDKVVFTEGQLRQVDKIVKLLDELLSEVCPETNAELNLHEDSNYQLCVNALANLEEVCGQNEL